MRPVFALILIVSLIVWSIGTPLFIEKASAASVLSFSDTLSDSDLSALSNHTIQFTAPNGVSAGQTIVLTFPNDFVLTNVALLDFDLNDGSELALALAPSGATWGVGTTSNSVTFTSGTGVIASSSVITIEIGTNATTGGAGTNRIVNPDSAGSNVISVSSGSGIDSGSTNVYIIDDVVVTASINTNLIFAIDGVASGQSVNGSPTTTADTTTSTSVPFGTLVAGTSKVLAQDISVTTNATNGFVVTIQQDQNLTSNLSDIDGFINGAYTNTPTAWVGPTPATGQENTYGHMGITSEDDLNTNEFGTDLWVSASTTPRQVFSHNGVSDGTTANIGRTRVGYQVEISSLQEAGTDYTNTITYIVTPTF